MQNIYLDSQAIIGFGVTLTGIKAGEFFDLARHVGSQVYVPELVLEETAAHKVAMMADLREKLEKEEGGLKAFIPDLAIPSLGNREQVAGKIEQVLRQQLALHGAQIIEMSSRCLAEFTNAVLRYAKRTSGLGDLGLRDALHLMTVVDHGRSTGCQSALFVTADGFHGADVPKILEMLGAGLLQIVDSERAKSLLQENLQGRRREEQVAVERNLKQLIIREKRQFEQLAESYKFDFSSGLLPNLNKVLAVEFSDVLELHWAWESESASTERRCRVSCKIVLKLRLSTFARPNLGPQRFGVGDLIQSGSGLIVSPLFGQQPWPLLATPQIMMGTIPRALTYEANAVWKDGQFVRLENLKITGEESFGLWGALPK